MLAIQIGFRHGRYIQIFDVERIHKDFLENAIGTVSVGSEFVRPYSFELPIYWFRFIFSPESKQHTDGHVAGRTRIIPLQVPPSLLLKLATLHGSTPSFRRKLHRTLDSKFVLHLLPIF